MLGSEAVRERLKHFTRRQETEALSYLSYYSKTSHRLINIAMVQNRRCNLALFLDVTPVS